MQEYLSQLWEEILSFFERYTGRALNSVFIILKHSSISQRFWLIWFWSSDVTVFSAISPSVVQCFKNVKIWQKIQAHQGLPVFYFYSTVKFPENANNYRYFKTFVFYRTGSFSMSAHLYLTKEMIKAIHRLNTEIYTK